MQKKIFQIEVLVLLLVILFTFLVFYSFIVEDLTFLGIVLYSLIILMMSITYFLGFIKGVSISLFAIILIGIYIGFKTLNVDNFSINLYIPLLISIPVGSFLLGSISEALMEMKIKHEKCEKMHNYLIRTDEITGFGNDKDFLMDLEIEMAKAKRYKQPLVVGIFEIQYFNELKTLYPTGVDKLFKELSNVINEVVRIEDQKYRIDKDKVALIIPYTDIKGGKILKSRLKEKIKLIEIKNTQDKKNTFLIDIKMGLLEYNDKIPNNIEYKKMIEREIEYDV